MSAIGEFTMTAEQQRDTKTKVKKVPRRNNGARWTKFQGSEVAVGLTE